MLLRLLTFVGLFAAVSIPYASPAGQEVGVDQLKEQRVSFLEERIAVIQQGIDAGKLGAISKIQPQMELLKVRLEYADSDVERKKYYQELLSLFDRLIESAEAGMVLPVPFTMPGTDPNTMTAANILKLKADRAALQIEAPPYQ